MQLESLARQGDETAAAELAAVPPLPEAVAYLWVYYFDLARTRPSGGMAISRIDRHDIRQWQEDEFIVLEPWERRVLLEIDAAFIASTQPTPENEREEEA